MNQRAKYLGQSSFSSKVIVRIDTRAIALPGPLRWSVGKAATGAGITLLCPTKYFN